MVRLQASPAQRWRDLVVARLAEIESLSPGHKAVDASFWDSRARKFAARLPVASAARDPLLKRLRQATGRASTVIDIGAGTGRFALNLAPRVRSVTAVDPSQGMLRILRSSARQLGVDNVRTVLGQWEEVDVPPADVAFSSYVLPIVPDAPRFLTKLDTAAHRKAFLYLGAYSADAVVDPLWRHFHGAPRSPAPSYLDAVAVLSQLGIHPAVEVVEVANRTRFTSVAEAAKEYRDFLLLPDTREVRQELQGLLSAWLVKRVDGLAPPLRSVPAAIIGWETAS